MSPNIKTVEPELVGEQSAVEVPEITPEDFPEWHALAVEAMEEVGAGSVERWP